MERKYNTRTQDFRSNGSQHAELLARFRKQMADYARAEDFKRLRGGRHLSQEEAAHELGVSVKTIRSWEKGGGIKWKNAKRVARFYNVEPQSLVKRELSEGGSDEYAIQLDRLEIKLDRALVALGLDPEAGIADDLARRLGQEPPPNEEVPPEAAGQ